MVKKRAKKTAPKPRSAALNPLRNERKTLSISTAALSKETDPTLRLLWVDRMEMTVRGDIPIATLRFQSLLGDRLHEACNLQTSINHLRAMVDVICKNINHYPVKPSK